MFIKRIIYILVIVSLAHCTGKPEGSQLSFKKSKSNNQVITVNFPTQFRGATESFQILSKTEDQSFLFCCELSMSIPRATVVHLRLNDTEAYSPLNHKTELERICAYLDRDRIKREKAVLSQPLLLDLKATLLLARSEEIPKGKVQNCKLLNISENHFKEPLAPFFESYLFEKNPKKKRVIFFGASTMVDQGDFNPPPYIAEKISELYSSTPFETINLSTWSATLLDHMMNWERIQLSNEPVGVSRPYFSQANNLPEHPILLRGSFLGVKDLKPDLLVISSMWNDLPSSSLFFNSPASLVFDYLTTLLKTSLHPSGEENLKLKQLAKKISSAPVASEIFRQEQMGQLYYLLLNNFLKKIRSDHPQLPILLVTLPFGVNDTFLEKDLLLKNMNDSPVFERIYEKRFDLAHWNRVEKIQNDVSQKLKLEFKNVELLNISQEYGSTFALVSASRILSFNYFTEDLMHFSPAGNAFVATRLEEVIEKMLMNTAAKEKK